MTTDLDDLLGKIREEEKKKLTRDSHEVRQKRIAFRDAFRVKLQKVIHPTMIKVNEKLRYAKRLGRVIREKKDGIYDYEKYEIHPATNNQLYFKITVLGNYDLMKVCVFTEYFSPVNGANHQMEVSLKKTEEQFDLEQITADLLEKIVANDMVETANIQPPPKEEPPK